MKMEASNIELKRAVLRDILTFIESFNTSNMISYTNFYSKWEEMDLDLLIYLSSQEILVTCLFQIGLLGPTNSFQSHQILVFCLYSIFKYTKKPFKLSTDRIQFLLGIRMRAALDENSKDTVDALEALFRKNAFVIVAEDNYNKYINLQSSVLPSSTSIYQIMDRIKCIEQFLTTHPLFDQKFQLPSILRLRNLFDQYYEAKRNSFIVLEEEQNFGSAIDNILKIIENYEESIKRSTIDPSVQMMTASTSKSIRSRLSQNSLTPIPTNVSSTTASPVLPSDLFPSMRAQSVPVTKMRRTSNLKEVDLDEFLEYSTSSENMPNINFY